MLASLQLLAAVLMMTPTVAEARPSDLAVRFETFSGADGLSSTRIASLLQDQRGYLWFATEYGLNRYDGYEFKQYLHEPTDPNSISGGFIHFFDEDGDGRLWIRLVLDGVTHFDPRSGRFRHHAHDADDPGSIAAGSVVTMTTDAQGQQWFVFRDGSLDQYDAARGRFVHHGVGLRKFLGGRALGPQSLLADDDGHLWLASDAGDILRYQPDKAAWVNIDWRTEGFEDDRLSAWTLGRDHRLWIASSRGRLLELDRDSLQWVEHSVALPEIGAGACFGQVLESQHLETTLWLSFGPAGLGRYDYASRQLTHYPASDEEGERELGRRTLLSGGIQRMHEDRTGTLWLAPRWQGVLSHDPQTQLFRWHRYRAANPTSIGPYAVHQILEDHTGILWFASRGGGVSKFNPRQQCFSHDLYAHQFRDIVDGGSVTAGLETEPGIAWIGSAARGFFRYDRNREEITDRFFTDAADGTNMVNAMVRSRSLPHILWVGTNRGLVRVDTQTFETWQYTHDPQDPHSLGDNAVLCMTEDDRGQLWVGTNQAGLEVLDLQTQRFRHIPHDTFGPEGTSRRGVWAAERTRDGQLWFGIIPGGLHRYDPETDTFHHYVTEDEMSGRSRLPKSVYTIVEGDKGLLWLATYSDGLVAFDRTSESVVRYTREAGMPSNRIYGILQGPGREFWLSSDQGLTRFDRQTGSIENFDHSDGLQNDEFMPKGFWRAADGELFFGGIDGLTSFYPQEVERNPHAPPVQVTALRVLRKGGTVRTFTDVASGDTLVLDHSANHLEVEFAALDFSNPDKNLYSYCLDGSDKQWCAAGTRRFASWSHLDPGEYVLRIRASNNHGVWNDDGFSMAVVIQPPFYRTAWFMVLCIVLFGAAVWTAHRLRVRAATLRIRELERVRQDEVERVRKEAARDIHDELGHLVTRISLFGEIARQQLPVTMNGGSPAEYLDRITATSKDLAEGLGDFVWTLDPKNDSVFDVLVRLKDFGDKLFQHTGIDFQVVGLDRDLRGIHLSLDWRRHLTMLFKEGMTNVLKHSQGDSVELRVFRHEDLLHVSLADNGRGFDTSNGAHGRGNGLHNMEARARKLGGQVTIESEEGQGTRLAFTGLVPGDER